MINLGRYAVSLFGKYAGDGFRAYLDLEKLDPWPEIRGWFLKLVEKEDQDPDRLLAEIAAAGDSICTTVPVQIAPQFLGRSHMSAIGRCPVCKEAYPTSDGAACLACQRQTPYVDPARP